MKNPDHNSSNIWSEWVPEDTFAAVLAGEEIVADIGQVKGLWRSLLNREVKAGRLCKWQGYWHPIAGASWGMGPLKTCYGTPEARDAVQLLGAN